MKIPVVFTDIVSYTDAACAGCVGGHAPHAAFRAQHAAFRAQHAAFRAQHSAFRAQHSAFRAQHFSR
ncbi:MAG: hypothetical protein RRA94_15820, partial [Bacteroidota bacterium]|nr:hypothetical protein [Bacteroidota bacterium]